MHPRAAGPPGRHGLNGPVLAFLLLIALVPGVFPAVVMAAPGPNGVPRTLMSPVADVAPTPGSTQGGALLRSPLLRAAGLVAVSSFGDRTAADELPEMSGRGWRRASTFAEHLGNPLVLGAGLGLAWGVGRLTGHDGVAGSAARIAAGVVAAGATAGALKYAIGRARPFQAPDDADEYQPFSGWSSFPSGHTTVAFSMAAGIDQETSAGWVPWVVYPAAGIVGWSRMRDNRHWLSDVVAGALIGPLVSRFVVRRLQARRAHVAAPPIG